ncbi:MAG: hypothetical protein TH68_05620, partial [Candidatus Synechococcus spongiarum 142]
WLFNTGQTLHLVSPETPDFRPDFIIIDNSAPLSLKIWHWLPGVDPSHGHRENQYGWATAGLLSRPIPTNLEHSPAIP